MARLHSWRPMNGSEFTGRLNLCAPPLLGWKIGSARSAPPALRCRPWACDAIHTHRLGGGILVHPPRLRPQSSALDCSRIRIDDGICERVLPIDARKHPEVSCRNMPQCFAVGILDSVAKHRSTQRRERPRDSDAVQQLRDGSATCEVARMPGQAHSLYGPPAAVSRRQGGQVSSPLPGIGVNFFPQRRHRRFRTRRSSVSKNRPRFAPSISPPHAPDYRARARPGRARRPPTADRRPPTADRDCCPPPQLGHRNRVPRVLRRSPRLRHVPHVTPRAPAPAPEAHSPQRRHRHGRCRPDSPCRDHRERRRGRHPQLSAPTTRLAPRRDRPHSGSWDHRTLI